MATGVEDWEGQTVVDRSGEKIGTIEEIFLVEETGQPEWALVKIGRLKSHATLVPLMRASSDANGVRIAYEKGTVEEAPRVDPDREPSEEEVKEIYRHYGIDVEGGQSAGASPSSGNGAGGQPPPQGKFRQYGRPAAEQGSRDVGPGTSADYHSARQTGGSEAGQPKFRQTGPAPSPPPPETQRQPTPVPAPTPQPQTQRPPQPAPAPTPTQQPHRPPGPPPAQPKFRQPGGGEVVSGSPDLRDEPITDLLKSAKDEASTFVKKDLELAKAEMGLKAKEAGIGAGMFGGAGYFGHLAMLGLMLCVIFALATAMQAWLAALIVTVVFAAIAGALALAGKKKIEKAGPPVPEQAVEAAKQTIQNVKEEARWGLGKRK